MSRNYINPLPDGHQIMMQYVIRKNASWRVITGPIGDDGKIIVVTEKFFRTERRARRYVYHRLCLHDFHFILVGAMYPMQRIKEELGNDDFIEPPF